jgi:uncharacterized protein with NAD-binding domain and iron-sulfur cluster
MANAEQQKNVVILGGGIGAISTAFWLTSTEELRKRFKVSIYTHGWRLGGKAASGRDAQHGNRIQEHGLHILMGWYEIAFKTIRACYAEWHKDADNPFQTWHQAFTPLAQVTLEQEVPDQPPGAWKNWQIEFPPLPGSPGESCDDFILEAVHTAIEWLHNNLWHDLELPDALVALGGLARLDAAHNAAKQIPQAPANLHPQLFDETLQALKDFQAWFRLAEPIVSILGSDGLKICALTDFGLAVLIGYIKDVLPHGEDGFEGINDREFRDWLVAHGATPRYTRLAPVRVLYDMGFAYLGGDSSSIDNGKIAAGTGLRVLLIMSTRYKGAPLWKMNAGMGDTIFSPMYQVLRARNVSINLFHRVKDIRLDSDGSKIETVSLERQVIPKADYDPLTKVNGLPCWPSQPKWNDIVDGDKLSEQAWDLESMWCDYRTPGVADVTLKINEDFDIVVLAIPPAALPDIGRDLLERCPSIKAMHDGMSWVATQAAQLWFAPDLAHLGWRLGPTVAIGYADPFRSWGEMSHLLAAESWNDPKPGSCEYLCGTITTPLDSPPYGSRNFITQQTARVAQNFNQWSAASVAHLWPGAVDPGGNGLDRALVISEFYRINLDPSEMYVQTFPKSVAHRLSPRLGASGIGNLSLAGDWTKGKVNAGCAEGAFESGKLAAEAICNEALDLPLF